MGNAFPTANTVADYGGIFSDGGVKVVDPTTDQSAAQYAVHQGSTAALTHTGAKAWVRFVAGTSPALAASNNGDAAWGNDPSVRATPLRTGTGTYTLTWPTSVVDLIGNTQSVLFVRATAQSEGSTLAFARVAVTSANILTVSTFNAAGSANDVTGITIHVQAF
jgi:hypothetical protein